MTARRTRAILAAGALLGAAVGLACHPPYPFRWKGVEGRVVDADSGAPVRDAVVVAVRCWDFVRMDGGPEFAEAEEQVTGDDGHFAFPARLRVAWNPFNFPDETWIATFRPGYAECIAPPYGSCDAAEPTLRRLGDDERAQAFRDSDLAHAVRSSSGGCSHLPARSVPRLAAAVAAEGAWHGKPLAEPLAGDELERTWRIVVGEPPDAPVPAIDPRTTAAGSHTIRSVKEVPLPEGVGRRQWRDADGRVFVAEFSRPRDGLDHFLRYPCPIPKPQLVLWMLRAEKPDCEVTEEVYHRYVPSENTGDGAGR